jgi:alkanesulfonate monooxygenase SsuD/methylene tetrahydromethanopterin reductase-like flavin-dependent oxidoreductase (luciferase family)
MRHGLLVSNLGSYSDPKVSVTIARAAETAGWEAVLVWDHLGFVWGRPAADPWTVLAAVGASTSSLLVGTCVTPLPRRRLHTLAHQLATLDGLTRGRVVFGAGLGGVPREFSAFGEEDDAKLRAAKLDEGLGVLHRLLSGEEVSHHGAHYSVEGVKLEPVPVIPIPLWIGGSSEPALRRAARWDGWIPESADLKAMVMSPEEVADGLTTIQGLREATTPFAVAIYGYSEPGDSTLRDEYAEAGATWWLEYVHDERGRVSEGLARVEAGP